MAKVTLPRELMKSHFWILQQLQLRGTLSEVVSRLQSRFCAPYGWEGIRSSDVSTMLLEADKVSINSAAVTEPGLSECSNRFSSNA